jgi:hypothetical protein
MYCGFSTKKKHKLNEHLQKIIFRLVYEIDVEQYTMYVQLCILLAHRYYLQLLHNGKRS